MINVKNLLENRVQKTIPVEITSLKDSLFSNEKHANFSIDGRDYSAIIHTSAIEQGNIFLDVMNESADSFLVRVPGKMSGSNLLTISKEVEAWCYRIAKFVNR